MLRTASGQRGFVAVPRALTQVSVPWWRVAVIAVIGTGTILRLIGITHQSLWLDEAFSVYLAAHRFPQIVSFVAGSDAHPPLYYLILHLWMFIGSSELAVRLLSWLASSCSLLLVYALGVRLANRRVGLVATGLMAISAFQVWYAQEARMYAPVTLAVVLAVYALIRGWQTGSREAWLGFAVAVIVAGYLDYSALYVYSALIVWYALDGRKSPNVRLPFLYASVAIVGGFLPWLPALYAQLGQVTSITAWIDGSSGSGFVPTLTDLLFNRTKLNQPSSAVWEQGFQLLSLALLVLALIVPRRRRSYSLPALWLASPLGLGIAAGLAGHPTLIAHSMMVVEPALFLLLALAADTVWDLRLRDILPAGALACCLGIFAAANLQAQVSVWSTTYKEDWRGAADLVAVDQQSGDLLLFNAYYAEMPFDYYFRQHQGLQSSLVERGCRAQELLLYGSMEPPVAGVRSGRELARYPRIWLILSHEDKGPRAKLLPAWLLKHDRLEGRWTFVGVTVELFAMSG